MKALIAMSGGVDSSVAALLMQEHERVGCTMRLFDAEENENKRPNTCCSLEDVEDSRIMCSISPTILRRRSSGNSSRAIVAGSRPIPVSTATAI